MANPRKFSEKIALHNQKQAEETAAFEEILREVSETTKAAVARQQVGIQQQHMHLTQPNLGAYRGGSLPNVNQIGNHSIDLQGALNNLEDMKQASGRQSLVDRFHRERNRQLQGHRRPFPFDKRIDCSPYGSAYLSPPPDSSWRRTNSDSALHTSAMTPPSQPLPGATTPPAHRRVDVSGQQSVPIDSGQIWDPKKQQELAQSRPKSCEVPGINIYPSPEQDSGVHIPISNNTGSLPDLTNLHFPSPLATPLDAEDQTYTQGNSPGNLSPTAAHHMAAMQASPGSRRRHPHGGPSPLVLHGSPTQMRHNMTPQGNSLEVNVNMLSVDTSRLHPYHPYHLSTSPHRQQAHLANQTLPSHLANHKQPHLGNQVQMQQPLQSQKHLNVDSVNPTQAGAMTHYRNSQSDCPQSPMSPSSQHSYSPSQSPGLPNTSTASNSPFTDDYYNIQQQTTALQHQFEQFNMVRDSSLTNGSVNRYSSMNPNTGGSGQFSQAVLVGGQEFSQGNQDFVQNHFFSQSPQQPSSPQQQHSPQLPASPQSQAPPHQFPPSPTQILTEQQLASLMSSNHNQHSNNIPDIILTDPGLDMYGGVTGTGGRPVGFQGYPRGADEALRQDFAKDIGHAMAGMPDSLDSDLFPPEEALKVGLDPLDLEMLTDPNLVTDPATEDSFRLDRL